MGPRCTADAAPKPGDRPDRRGCNQGGGARERPARDRDHHWPTADNPPSFPIRDWGGCPGRIAVCMGARTSPSGLDRRLQGLHQRRRPPGHIPSAGAAVPRWPARRTAGFIAWPAAVRWRSRQQRRRRPMPGGKGRQGSHRRRHRSTPAPGRSMPHRRRRRRRRCCAQCSPKYSASSATMARGQRPSAVDICCLIATKPRTFPDKGKMPQHIGGCTDPWSLQTGRMSCSQRIVSPQAY